MMGLILISSTGLSIHHHICFEVQKEYVSISGDNHCDKTEKQSCCNITPQKSSKDDCCASEHIFSKLDIQAKNEKSDIIGHQLLVYVLPVIILLAAASIYEITERLYTVYSSGANNAAFL